METKPQMDDHNECEESYKECTATRTARVEKVLQEAKPGDTELELAERANVARRTIQATKKRLLQKAQPRADCNKQATVGRHRLGATGVTPKSTASPEGKSRGFVFKTPEQETEIEAMQREEIARLGLEPLTCEITNPYGYIAERTVEAYIALRRVRDPLGRAQVREMIAKEWK